MPVYAFDGSDIVAVADAVRDKAFDTLPMTVAGMPEMISRIPYVRFGRFTPEVDLMTKTIQHGLGRIPDVIVVYRTTTQSDSAPLTRIVYTRIPTASVNDSMQSTSANRANANTWSSTIITGITETAFTYQTSASHNRVLAGGVEYVWMAFAFPTLES